LGTLGNNATSVVICHNFIFLQWRLMCAIADRVLQSHLYFYFLTFGRSEQVLGQPMSKENIKLHLKKAGNPVTVIPMIAYSL
jgi:hypothetical protein